MKANDTASPQGRGSDVPREEIIIVGAGQAGLSIRRSAVNPLSSTESTPSEGSSFSVFPGSPRVGRHWWDGSVKMPDDSQLCFE